MNYISTFTRWFAYYFTGFLVQKKDGITKLKGSPLSQRMDDTKTESCGRGKEEKGRE